MAMGGTAFQRRMMIKVDHWASDIQCLSIPHTKTPIKLYVWEVSQAVWAPMAAIIDDSLDRF